MTSNVDFLTPGVQITNNFGMNRIDSTITTTTTSDTSSFNNITAVNFFHGNIFQSIKPAVQFIKETYAARKRLKENTQTTRGGRKIDLVCSVRNCSFRIVCRYRRSLGFTLDEKSSNFRHGIYDTAGHLSSLCTGTTCLTTRDILEEPIYNCLKNSESNRKNMRIGKVSIHCVKTLLAVSNSTSADSNFISDDRIKKANAFYKISAYEHFIGFDKLNPYLEAYLNLNPGFKFKLEKDRESHEFKRVAILFPYSTCAQKYCYKVYGIDAAHTERHVIRGFERKRLEDYINWPTGMRIMFDECFLFAVTGRTITNQLIIFALSIGYSECIEDYEFLFQFLTDNEFEMNKPDVTILSDRGSAILPTIQKCFPLAFLKPCAIHLKRNLVDNGFGAEDLIALYWKATNACTRDAYNMVIEEMKVAGSNGKGLKMVEYLSKVSNWQLFKAIERGMRLYEMKSDNIVEIVFAFLLECRSYVTPYYILASIFLKNVKRLSTIQKECFHNSEFGLTVRADEIYLENNLTVNLTSYEVVITDIDQVCGIVSLLGEHKMKTKKYNVNMSRRTCDCNHYQQSGCPCLHAIALIRHLQVPMKKQYFYDFCFNEYLEKMIEAGMVLHISKAQKGNSCVYNKYTTVLPGDEHIEELLVSDADNDNSQKHHVVPSIRMINTLDTLDNCTSSDKRIRSKGDFKNSSTRKVSKRTTCPRCQKNISKTTKHGANACLRFLRLHNINHELVVITPIGL